MKKLKTILTILILLFCSYNVPTVNAKDKVKYTLEIKLTKDDDGNWMVDALTNEQIKKIQGMY